MVNFDRSLHDAYIEKVVIGPRREVSSTLALGSARISDPRLPPAATLRIGGIANFDQVREFFSRFGENPIGRIDRMTVLPGAGNSSNVVIEIGPEGTIEVACRNLALIVEVDR